MGFELMYWHWLVFGMILVAGEIFIPSFTILWFGLGALVVGLLMLVLELNFPAQILIWTLASVASTILWFKYFKPKMIDRTSAGISRDAAIGEAGQVIKAPTEHSRGQVRFTTPVLGDDEWDFICDSEVALGDRVHIKEISGNTLIVVKLS
jgi:membrane protein implicated in regulation of membrane protease activity|tara:strand:+ start:10960 stop:11412 length:453 start_codon:yes stop_codon:yes gene_type:complete